MINPYLNKQHIRDYLAFGSVSALLYSITAIFFMIHHNYGNFYLLYIGNLLFMFGIFYYAFRLLYRRYDKRRAAVMLIAGHLATLAGVIMACTVVFISFLLFFPHPVSVMPPGKILKDTPAAIQPQRPSGLLILLLLNAFVGNFGAGSAISVITSYAGKIDQTKDKPADLSTHIPGRKNRRGKVVH